MATNKLILKARRTLVGYTYQPGEYEVVEGNDALPGQMTAAIAAKMEANYSGDIGEAAKPKAEVPKATTSKVKAGKKS